MDNINDILKDASEIVEEQWQVERKEDIQTVPPSFEVTEDEINAIEAMITASLKALYQDIIDLRFRTIIVWRMVGANAPIWHVKGCMEGICDNSKCEGMHHLLCKFLVGRKNDGTYVVLEDEKIMDKVEENAICLEENDRAQAVPIALEELADMLSGKMKGKGGEDDPLPPAASVEAIPTEELVFSLLRRAWQKLRRRA